jgi:hypothetical protein
LEAYGEGDFADPQIWMLQQIARFRNTCADDISDKVFARYFGNCSPNFAATVRSRALALSNLCTEKAKQCGARG